MKNDKLGFKRIKLQRFGQMPGNGLPFAVFIGSEPNGFGRFSFRFKFADNLFLVGRNHILRLIIIVDFNPKLFRFQIANMTVARSNLKLLPQKLFNCFSLCRRFNYYEILLHASLIIC